MLVPLVPRGSHRSLPATGANPGLPSKLGATLLLAYGGQGSNFPQGWGCTRRRCHGPRSPPFLSQPRPKTGRKPQGGTPGATASRRGELLIVWALAEHCAALLLVQAASAARNGCTICTCCTRGPSISPGSLVAMVSLLAPCSVSWGSRWCWGRQLAVPCPRGAGVRCRCPGGGRTGWRRTAASVPGLH